MHHRRPERLASRYAPNARLLGLIFPGIRDSGPWRPGRPDRQGPAHVDLNQHHHGVGARSGLT
jgi:hypothetical protein